MRERAKSVWEMWHEHEGTRWPLCVGGGLQAPYLWAYERLFSWARSMPHSKQVVGAGS